MKNIISIDNVESLVEEILKDLPSWRKNMIHYIKDENPELNTAIIELSQKSGLDPKALATGAYMAYKLLESESDDSFIDGALFEEE